MKRWGLDETSAEMLNLDDERLGNFSVFKISDENYFLCFSQDGQGQITYRVAEMHLQKRSN